MQVKSMPIIVVALLLKFLACCASALYVDFVWLHGASTSPFPNSFLDVGLGFLLGFLPFIVDDESITYGKSRPKCTITVVLGMKEPICFHPSKSFLQEFEIYFISFKLILFGIFRLF
jgi:hypothetical protein